MLATIAEPVRQRREIQVAPHACLTRNIEPAPSIQYKKLSRLDIMNSSLYYSTMKPQIELVNQVRQYRRSADITQEQLAEQVGVTRQTILSIEKGKYTPSVALALQLSAALRVRVDELFQLQKGEVP